MAEHTPPPWLVNPIGYYHIETLDGNGIGMVWDSLADATLMAASPEMLDALLQAATAFSLMHDANQLPYFAKEPWHAVAAAIAKARGETVLE